MNEAELLQIESKDDMEQVFIFDVPRMAAEIRRCWARIQELEKDQKAPKEKEEGEE